MQLSSGHWAVGVSTDYLTHHTHCQLCSSWYCCTCIAPGVCQNIRSIASPSQVFKWLLEMM